MAQVTMTGEEYVTMLKMQEELKALKAEIVNNITLDKSYERVDGVYTPVISYMSFKHNCATPMLKDLIVARCDMLLSTDPAVIDRLVTGDYVQLDNADVSLSTYTWGSGTPLEDLPLTGPLFKQAKTAAAEAEEEAKL